MSTLKAANKPRPPETNHNGARLCPKILFENYILLPAVVLGDFSQVGTQKLTKTFKRYGLVSIFEKKITTEKGKELDGVFTNINCVTNNMVRLEGIIFVSDHKLLTLRLQLDNRDVIMREKKAS